jgi:hypothetical protein
MDQSDVISRDLSREHVAALDTLRHAKSAAFWLAVIAILVHVAAWYLVRYTDVLDSAASATTNVADASDTMNGDEVADRWESRLQAALGVAGFVGRAAVVVLVGLLMLSVLVSLSARLGGAAGLSKAFVWSLLALAMLVPWDRLTPDEVKSVPAAFYSMSDLTGVSDDPNAVAVAGDRIDLKDADTMAKVLDGMRYAGYPLIVLLVLIAAQSNFRAGYRRVVIAPTARLPMREV